MEANVVRKIASPARSKTKVAQTPEEIERERQTTHPVATFAEWLGALKVARERRDSTGEDFFIFRRARLHTKTVDGVTTKREHAETALNFNGCVYPITDEELLATAEEMLPPEVSAFFANIDLPLVDVVRDSTKHHLLTGDVEHEDGSLDAGLWLHSSEQSALRRVNARYGIPPSPFLPEGSLKAASTDSDTFEQRLHDKVMWKLSRALPAIIREAIEEASLEDAEELEH